MRYHRNDLLARPEKFAGPLTMGVATHPGFHTAEERATTYAYAQIKAAPPDLDDDETDTVLDDYPVVLAIDMSGLTPKTDYDAVKMVEPVLRDVAKEIERNCDGSMLATLEEYVEYGESEPRQPPTAAVDWLFEFGAAAVLDPASSLLAYADQQEDPETFLSMLAQGKLPDAALAAITGQFRYTEDVDSRRIVAVEYMQPWWPRVLVTMASEDDQELAEAAEALGWSVVDEDDVLSGSLDSKETTVYERAPGTRARVEYHGTSYRNLLSAAPELMLPVPPPPYVG